MQYTGQEERERGRANPSNQSTNPFKYTDPNHQSAILSRSTQHPRRKQWYLAASLCYRSLVYRRMLGNALHAIQIASPAINFFTFSSASLFNNSLASPSLCGPSSVSLPLVPSTITTTPLTPMPLSPPFLTIMLPTDFCPWVAARSCSPILTSQKFLASFVRT